MLLKRLNNEFEIIRNLCTGMYLNIFGLSGEVLRFHSQDLHHLPLNILGYCCCACKEMCLLELKHVVYKDVHKMV